jgi:hypothetical protein
MTAKTHVHPHIPFLLAKQQTDNVLLLIHQSVEVQQAAELLAPGNRAPIPQSSGSN